ncbi:MAG: ABC transporter permease/substrate-binding protein [Myxococcota bacterium]
MNEQLEKLPELLTAHLQITIVALLIATAISIPLGVAASRVPWLKSLALTTAGIIQTIPSLALLAIMVPLLTAAGLQGIGFLPAFIGLTLYCLLPILMGTVTGISEVDPAMVEAARGVGMTPMQRLRLVELPLSMPVIVSGLRTSTVWCVGMATLSTPVGAPSLGNYIFGGLQTRNFTAVLVGCVAAALLAQILDRLVQALEVGTRTRRRGLVLGASTVLGVIVLYSGGSFAAASFEGDENKVRIGAKTFTEQFILAEVFANEVTAKTDLRPEVMPSLGSTVAFDALQAGEIDLYVEYSGTVWATILDRTDVPEDRAAVMAELHRALPEDYGITILAVLGFENTYALAMPEPLAAQRNIERISDLTRHAPDLDIGGDFEFFERTEWESLVDTYGLAFSQERAMDAALMYQAAGQGTVDVISAYSTDGRIASFNLRVLEDDRGAIPPYDAILLASQNFMTSRPELAARLRDYDGAISAERMRELNARVDADGLTPSQAAAEFQLD